MKFPVARHLGQRQLRPGTDAPCLIIYKKKRNKNNFQTKQKFIFQQQLFHN